MPKQPKIVRTVRVPADLWQAAKDRADQRGETVTDVIIRALVNYTKGKS